MKEIPLTKDKFALVDNEDFAELSKHKWYASQESKNGLKWYAVRRITVDGRRFKIRMHRLIMGLGTGFEDSRVVHHKDCDGLNNQKSNLEILEHNHANMVKEPGWQTRKKVECFL